MRTLPLVAAVALLAACRTSPKGDDTSGLTGDEVDADGDGFPAAEDCDDTDASVHPGATEECNGVDDDCNDQIDEGVETRFHADADGDTYGDASAFVSACSAPEGYVEDDTDCDDADADIHPDAPERCDGVDQDCDGEIDEDVLTVWFADADGDGFGDAAAPLDSCDPTGGYVADATDCDDTDDASHPGAAEVCDEADNDCDGDTDEGVTDTYWADVDGDGFGDASVTVEACSQPSGFATTPGDCDDTDFDTFPGAPELCDGADDDCDGDIDEDDALDAATWYADGDGDGFGDAAASTAACSQPSGHVADATDCDDTTAAVSPAAAEVCNGVDDDCDGATDDADSGVDVSTGATWYADTDADGYGDAASTVQACVAPAGYGADATDCDDTTAAVSPAATEVCNSIDDDCDGDIDDDDSSLDTATASAWYADADTDGYGDPSASSRTCVQPSGTVTDATDCDDTDPDSHPGAVELRDGADNDCDGAADDGLWRGTGVDGALSVTGATDLSADASGSRTDPDAVAYAVTALGADSVTVDGTVSGIAAGDEVLLINLQGSGAAYASVGAYEFATVDAVSGSTLTLAQALAETFGETSNADLTDQVIVVQRVPHYTDVSVAAGGSLTTAAWDGLSGGVLAFRATGSVEVASGGFITVAASGYGGGTTGLLGYNCDSYQGESYIGQGDGEANGTCAAYNEAYGLWAANAGGGGAHICGGGGEYGGGAEDADSWTGGSATPAYAGATYGDATLSTLFFGSGGGGVWNGDATCTGSGPGSGGAGGGIVLIGADTIETGDSDAILAYGGSTTACARGSWTYGAGGGAGGSVWLVADTVDLAADSVDATGGTGEQRNIRKGGNGGSGRVRIDCTDCNGYASGSPDADSALAAATEPDPGYSSTP